MHRDTGLVQRGNISGTHDGRFYSASFDTPIYEGVSSDTCLSRETARNGVSPRDRRYKDGDRRYKDGDRRYEDGDGEYRDGDRGYGGLRVDLKDVEVIPFAPPPVVFYPPSPMGLPAPPFFIVSPYMWV